MLFVASTPRLRTTHHMTQPSVQHISQVQLTSNQLVQSHTPLRSLVSSYADKHVLVLGTRNDACRKVANSYGMKNAWIAQDIIAYRQNVWPKTRLTEEDKGYVRVSLSICSKSKAPTPLLGWLIFQVSLPTLVSRFLLHTVLGHIRHARLS